MAVDAAGHSRQPVVSNPKSSTSTGPVKSTSQPRTRVSISMRSSPLGHQAERRSRSQRCDSSRASTRSRGITGDPITLAQREIVTVDPDGSGELIVSVGAPGSDRARLLEEDRGPAWSPDRSPLGTTARTPTDNVQPHGDAPSHQPERRRLGRQLAAAHSSVAEGIVRVSKSDRPGRSILLYRLTPGECCVVTATTLLAATTCGCFRVHSRSSPLIGCWRRSWARAAKSSAGS